MKSTQELTAGFGSRVPQIDYAEIRQSMQPTPTLWQIALLKLSSWFQRQVQ